MRTMRRMFLAAAAAAVLAGCGGGEGSSSGPDYVLAWDKSVYVASTAAGTRNGVQGTLTIEGSGDQSMLIGVNFSSASLPTPQVWFMTLGRSATKSNSTTVNFITRDLPPGIYSMRAWLTVGGRTWESVATVQVQQ